MTISHALLHLHLNLGNVVLLTHIQLCNEGKQQTPPVSTALRLQMLQVAACSIEGVGTKTPIHDRKHVSPALLLVEG